MTKDNAHKVYDILVRDGKANENNREGFVYHHTESKSECNEWRFRGNLGFGGKYWCKRNVVTCYSEDETPEALKTIEKINTKLSELDIKL